MQPAHALVARHTWPLSSPLFITATDAPFTLLYFLLRKASFGFWPVANPPPPPLPRAATYARYDELRRHPNGIVLLRCIFDVVFAVSVIIETSMRVTGHAADWADCSGFSFVTQFSVLGSELTFASLSYDLFTALRNPFVNYKLNLRKYRVGVVAVAAATAGALIGSGSHGELFAV